MFPVLFFLLAFLGTGTFVHACEAPKIVRHDGDPGCNVQLSPYDTHCCRYCPEGFIYENPTTCKACEAGQYHIGGMDSLESYCHPCPLGKAAGKGKVQCDICPAGYISSTDRSKCTACSAGQFAQSSSGLNIRCETCPPGKVTEGTWCEECPAGSIASADRSKCEEHAYIQISGPVSEFPDGRQTCSGDNVLWVDPNLRYLGSYKYAIEDDAIAACDANVACVGYMDMEYGDKPYVLCRQFHGWDSKKVVWKHPSVCRHPYVETACGPRHPDGTFVEPHCEQYSYQCPKADWWTCAAP